MVADSSKKIILYCHNYYAKDTGGGEYSVYKNDVAMLKAEGHEVIEYNRDDNEFFNRGFFKKVKRGIFSFYNPEVVKEITEIVRRRDVNIAIVQNTYLSMSPSIYIVLRKLNVPIIQMVYNYRFICPNAQLYVKGKICERCISGNYFNAVLHKCRANRYSLSLWFAVIVFIKRKVLKADKIIDKFITPDKFLRNKLWEGGISKDKIEVLKNPFEHKHFSVSNEDEGYFLFIGRLIRAKGIFTFLEAAKTLNGINFKIIGEGEEENNIITFIGTNNLKNVEFLGPKFNEEMITCLSKARALVVPSEWYDNYPLVISYAYALGKPVIASNINGIPEVIFDGETGFLFEPGNFSDLCEKINQIEQNPDKSKIMGNNGNLFLKNELSVTSRYKKFNRLINILSDPKQNEAIHYKYKIFQ